ncbi:MAG TPA: hypothetical protein VL523_18980 [Terriglobia bacterium]|nr:hypothetical protein [Terriglobia bacterium]
MLKKAVVIGGHTRNIGKTSVMSALIREFAPLGWTAVKITQYGHGVCSHDGHACDCAPEEHPFALSEETDSQGRADTSRFLAAGARRSLWLRVRQGQLSAALPLLGRKLRGDEWVILESNSILEFMDPLLYLAVLNGSKSDFKLSARRALARADALIAVEAGCAGTDAGRASWTLREREAVASKPVYPVRGPGFWSRELAEFVRQRLNAAAGFAAPREARSTLEETWLH